MPFCFSKDRKLGKMLVLSESLTLFEFSWKQNSRPILWIYLLEALQFKLSTQLWHCLIFQKRQKSLLKKQISIPHQILWEWRTTEYLLQTVYSHICIVACQVFLHICPMLHTNVSEPAEGRIIRMLKAA